MSSVTRKELNVRVGTDYAALVNIRFAAFSTVCSLCLFVLAGTRAEAQAPMSPPGLHLMGSASTGYGWVPAVEGGEADMHPMSYQGVLLGVFTAATYRSRRGFEVGGELGLRHLVEVVDQDRYWRLDPFRISTISAGVGGHWPLERVTLGFVFMMGLAISDQRGVDPWGAREKIIALGPLFAPELVIEKPIKEHLGWRFGLSSPMGFTAAMGGVYFPAMMELRFGIVWARSGADETTRS